MKVLTTRGEIEFERLEVRDVVELDATHRKIATEYRLDGELVRRDVTKNELRPSDAPAGVFTTHGCLSIDELEVTDRVDLGDNHRKITTEYRLHGELVRSDVTVSGLRPLMSAPELGRIN